MNIIANEKYRRALPGPWFDRSKQPRCQMCGRFAYWDEELRAWRLRCVVWDAYFGAWEHE